MVPVKPLLLSGLLAFYITHSGHSVKTMKAIGLLLHTPLLSDCQWVIRCIFTTLTGTVCKARTVPGPPSSQVNAQNIFLNEILPFREYWWHYTTTVRKAIESATMTYPDTWPKFNQKKPWLLSSRITDAEKSDLYARRVTAKELADRYNTHEKYIAGMFPGRAPTPKEPLKRDLPITKARREFRMAICVEVLKGKHTVLAASQICSCSYNTMQRMLAIAKKMHPELVKGYNDRLENYRKNFNKRVQHEPS